MSVSSEGLTEASDESEAVPTEPDEVLPAVVEPPAPRPNRRERLRRRIADSVRFWRTSLGFRVVAVILATSLLAMTMIGVTVLAAVRTQIYNRAVASYINQFEGSYAMAESTFDSVASPTAGQIQQLANSVVASQIDTSRSIMGSALLRTDSSAASGFQILEPSTQVAGEIRRLITKELRAGVGRSDDAHWQPIALPNLDNEKETVPGIMVGKRISVPGAGSHEFYVAYSMESQEYTMRIVLGLVTLGFLALVVLLGAITYLVTRMVLAPVREASAKASRLADGDYDVRMKVDGEDELAQLARSFNSMASSIEDQIERYERVSNVQQAFVSAISHELRSPVTTIRMAGQLIYDKREELPKALKRSAELQHKQLINLDTMLSDLLEISRYDAGAMTLATEDADLAEIVANAVAAQMPLAEDNGVQVEVDVEGDATARIEARRIERVIRNLVVNGLEHAEGRLLKIRVRGNDSAVAVEVSDHGVGLTPEHAAHVFDRFWRADPSRVRKSGGTGLGLTIAREDAELHGGTLECAGELGVGATFLLTLPRVAGEAIEELPIELRVAALEEEWPDPAAEEAEAEAEKDTAEEAEGARGEGAGTSEENSSEAPGPDTAEVPRVRVGEGSQSRELTVMVPSSGVAVIQPDALAGTTGTQEERS